MSDKVKLEVGQWLHSDASGSRVKVIGLCGDAVIVRWESDAGTWTFDINRWPSGLMKPAPPESPDDVVHEFDGELGRVQVARDGRVKALPGGSWVDSKWGREIARLAIAARGRV